MRETTYLDLIGNREDIMSTKHLYKIIHLLVAIVFVTCMVITWIPRDFAFWCFLISVLLIIINSFLIGLYIEKKHDKKVSTMEQAMYVVPAGTLVAVILALLILPERISYNCNIYLAVHIVIFAISVILQLWILNGISSNRNQETDIEKKRWDKDEVAYEWIKIKQNLMQYEEAKQYAVKMENEIKYSDPMSSELLSNLEQEIGKITKELIVLSSEKEKDLATIIALEKQVMDMVEERNNKCKRLK